MWRGETWLIAATALLLAMVMPCALLARAEPTVDELKARVVSTDISGRPRLCIRISEMQVDAAGKFYGTGDSEKAKAALVDVSAFADLARDYSIQSHKHEKQAEIALRKMARKLSDLKHSVIREDQAPVQETIDHLEKVRDDLLLSMFPKGGKE